MDAKPDATKLQTRSQRYAQKAFACVQKIANDKTLAEKYQSYARNLPTMILQCGLAQTVAFVQAKQQVDKDNKPVDAYAHWLADMKTVLENKELCKQAREAGLSAYMLLTYQTLDAAGWLKRYAEALIEKPNADAKPSGEGASDEQE